MGLLLFVAFVLMVILICLGPFWLDRVIVFVMRNLHIYLFPIAIRIAYSLEREPEEWALDVSELKHPTIGTIKFTTRVAWDIRIDLPTTNLMCGQRWKPNYIERRIICNAVDGLVLDRRMSLLNRTLPRLPM